jgi:DNA-binding FadR family transcriptional regulator
MNCLREAISALMEVAWPGQPDMKASYEMHVRIATAIRKKDIDGARQAMMRHMDGMERELREVGLLK